MSDYLQHNGGWTKPNAKYVKKIPKPGGGFYYVYPEDLKNKAKGAINKVRGAVNKAADKLGVDEYQALKKAKKKMPSARSLPTTMGKQTNRDKVARNNARNAASNLKKAQAAYDATPMGKAQKASKKLKNKIKKGAKALNSKLRAKVENEIVTRTGGNFNLESAKKAMRTNLGRELIKNSIRRKKRADRIVRTVGEAAETVTSPFKAAGRAIDKVVRKDDMINAWAKDKEAAKKKKKREAERARKAKNKK